MGKSVIAIDPGPVQSAILCWDGKLVTSAAILPNDEILVRLAHLGKLPFSEEKLAIEKIASFGMPVGAEVFETVFWSGRFAQAFGAHKTERITRHEVKIHVCNSARAKDGNIRQALIDRFGIVGTKKNPGPLFGVSSHLWSALAVAVTYLDNATF